METQKRKVHGESMATVEGYVEKIVYRNEENGYTVLSVAVEDDELTCVGSFAFVNEGEYLKLLGDYSAHSVYGEQFKVSSYETVQPKDELAIGKYLSSGAIKGIGEALATRIVKKFGTDTFRIIEEEPERLAEIKGISKSKAQEIFRRFYEKRELRGAMLFLQQYGISMNLAVKIQQFYGARMYEVINTNPYKLAEDINGVGFRTADEIAQRVGIAGNSEYRIRAALLYVLQQATANGHCYLPQSELLLNTRALLLVEEEEIDRLLDSMVQERQLMVRMPKPRPEQTTFASTMADGGVHGQTTLASATADNSVPRQTSLANTTADGVVKERRVYSPVMYYTELNVARMLLDLNRSCRLDEDKLYQRLEKVEKSFDITLDDTQRQAVAEAAKQGLFVLTGGPGTGKTTTINAMIRFFEAEGMEILLAAPTGRAAKRMTETTGKEARTIHRLLEISRGPVGENEDSRLGRTEKLHFERNERNPLEADVVIIDEVSMVDIHLLHGLLKAVSVGTRLILVGDENQLPSVGPGNVLHDILASGQIPVVRLKKIFRQAGESHIIVNAHRINAGQSIDIETKNQDFFMIKKDAINDVLGFTVALVRDKLPGYVKCSPLDIQVLTPMRKGELGVERLNTILQANLNPPSERKKEKEAHGILFREGDKVMQIKNNYQLEWEYRDRRGNAGTGGVGVFNGDIGLIRDINLFAQLVTVEFDESRFAEYSFADLEELELAYAVTIHKSQGSEYPAVVIPILTGPRPLLHRNLLYTAVTRAKKCVAMIGSAATVEAMVANVQEQRRYTSLTEHILEMTDNLAG